MSRLVLAAVGLLVTCALGYVLGFRRGSDERQPAARAVVIPVKVIDSSGVAVAEAERITREAAE